MSRTEEAAKRHRAGYNCCQAVACTFADKTGIDEKTLYKLSEGFGLGMGNMNGVCGAFSGAVLIAGFASSSGDTETPGMTKAETYKRVAVLQTEFEERAKRLICREIKKGNDGEKFTSCDNCIGIAVELLEEHFKQIGI